MTTMHHPINAKSPKASASELLRMLLSVGLLAIASAVAANQPPDIRFEHPLGQDDIARHKLGGLFDIVQDTFGFIWMSAENGLGRYDGRTLKLYQADPQSDRSLPSDHVGELEVDKAGVFWQAGKAGLSRYHPETDDFTHVTQVGGTPFTSEALSALAVAEDNTLYAGAPGGLHVISPDRKSMSVHLLPDIRSLAIDRQGRVWIATGTGAAVFDPATEHFSYIMHAPEGPNSLSYNNVKAILADNQGRIWLGTFGGGIRRLDPGSGEITHFTRAENRLGSDIVMDLIQDSEGAIWAALDQGGLALFDEATQSFHHYRHSPHNLQSLTSNQLRVLYEDRNKDLWIGAFPSGVSFYDRSAQVFDHHINMPDDSDSLSDDAILNFLQASDGTIWVGTENGLNAMDPQTGKFRRYLSDPSDPHALKANPVLAIEEDIDGQLWVGTWAGGLHRFNPETGLFKRYPANKLDPDAINGNFIWDIILASDNTLWIGTEDAGLHRYHRDTDSFSHYRHDPDQRHSIAHDFVLTLLEDRHGRLWVGTFAGLDMFDPETETFTHIPYDTGKPNATNSKMIRSLYEDSRGLIWVGSEQHGVDVYDPETQTFSHLGVSDGLLASKVTSIIEDDRGDIWLAAINGLARIDYNNLEIRHFGREDGIAGGNFTRDASLKDRDGSLYFGSTEGMTVFQPDDLRVTVDFPVRITQFRLFNLEVPIGTEDSPLDTSILVAEHIYLDHQDNMFSFELAALNYRQSASMHYSYMLEGFDRDWHDIGQSTNATYTNIGPGKYRFHTRASTDGQTWVEGQSVAVTVLPPPWRTWRAYALYALIIGVLLTFALKYLTLSVRAERYRNKSVTDPLTTLYNRAGIAQIAQGIFANAETKKGMCLMLMDVDHFKKVNDQSGHDAGDRILCRIASTVRDCLRNSDHFGRWGGEEFVLLCATQNSANSRLLAEKVRMEVANKVHDEQMPARITVSIGVADLGPNDSFESALKRADNALYTAKASGRNCVVVD